MKRPIAGVEFSRAPNTTSLGITCRSLAGAAGACAEAVPGAARARKTTKRTRRIGASLTRQRLARRMVRAVNVLVTVDAAAADQPVAARLQRHAVVNRRRMSRPDVAAPAQHPWTRDQHLFAG